ncbi:hypothetical protein GCM10018779_11030 [Streptomyces griseocarneus]|nr:hypothetical protein GCM10018779_11030 [Streptomyces griseocarneus]
MGRHPGDMRKARRNTHSLPLSTYSALGGLRQGPGRGARFADRGQDLQKWEIHEVHVLLWVYGSCADVESTGGRARRVRALGNETRVCASQAVAAATSDRS